MIISMHLYHCSNQRTCPHTDVCYHIKRNNNIGTVSDKTKQEVIDLFKSGKAEVYIATCALTYEAKTYLEMGMNLTLPLNIYQQNIEYLRKYKSQLQVSVYNLSDISLAVNGVDDINKIYLVKDSSTAEVAMSILDDKSVQNIHFAIAQDFVHENHILAIAQKWAACDDSSITIDSCLEGYLLHKTCSYATKKFGCNYIDINYDGTYRRCPFKKAGIPLADKSIEDLLNVEVENSCVYSYLIRGKNA